MKRSLKHLPEHKREELKRIVKVIRDYEDVYMIILFGSYARGDWVEDRYFEDQIMYEYKSDYDILVVPVNTKGSRFEYLEHDIESRVNASGASRTLVTVIVHGIKYVNKMIKEGRYFFADIWKEGIFLYNSRKKKLCRPKPLTPKKRKKAAQEDYKNWFKSAKEFFLSYKYALDNKHYKIAAFELHQATERFYHTVLLVYTHYKPKLHNIEKLGKQVSGLEPAFLNVIPKTTPEEERLFLLLKKAYIDARYSKDYKITKKELKYLGGKVKDLKRLTKKMCKQKIESFKQAGL